MKEKLFAEWLARDMGDAFVESIVLEKNVDGTYSQGMTRIKFNAFCAGLQSLPVLEGEPVAWLKFEQWNNVVDSFDYFSVCEEGDIGDDKAPAFPVYTHPAPFTPITADDVTDKVVMHLWSIGLLTHTGVEGKKVVQQIVNAFMPSRHGDAAIAKDTQFQSLTELVQEGQEMGMYDQPPIAGEAT
jgi:hypothetical protein